MSTYHIGIIEFYNFRNNFGYIISREQGKFKKQRFSKINYLNSPEFVPERDSIIYFTDIDFTLKIFPITDNINIPWDEILEYSNLNYEYHNKQTRHIIRILNFFDNLSDNEFLRLIYALHNKISCDSTNKDVVDNILSGSIINLFIKYGDAVFTADVSIECKTRFLELLSHIPKKADDGYTFLDSIADLLIDNESDIFREDIPFKCKRITLELLNYTFQKAINSNRLTHINRELLKYDTPECEWQAELINRINCLVTAPNELFICVKDLFTENLNILEHLNEVNGIYLYKEVLLAIAVVKKDISLLTGTYSTYLYDTEDGLSKFLSYFNEEHFKFLKDYINKFDTLFNSAYYNVIVNKWASNSYLDLPLSDGRPILRFLIDTEENHTIALIINKLVDKNDFFISCAQYYPLFCDDLKRIYIQALASKERDIEIFTRPTYRLRSSIASILSNDDFYKNHPNLEIRTEMIRGRSAQQFVDLKKIGLITNFSTSTIIGILNSLTNFEDQLTALKLLFNEDKKEMRYFVSKNLNGTTFASEFFRRERHDILNEIYREINDNSVIFDIEGEAEKGSGWEYAYSNAQEYKEIILVKGDHLIDNTQWKHLEDIIQNNKIIVGHNIREWDFKLLTKRNKKFGPVSKYHRYIWDTLEIEILLNPSRQSFALNAENGHNADKDVQANKILFWEQVYMILEDKFLFYKVKKYLPEYFIKFINEYLDIIYLPGNESKHNQQRHEKVFYTPSLINLSDLQFKDSTLIISHKKNWASIFQKCSTCFFIDPENSLDEYNRLDIKKIQKQYSKPRNIYEASLLAIVNDFSSEGHDLNIFQIPKLVREHIGDDSLRKYVLPHNASNIVCIAPHNIREIEKNKYRFSNIVIFNEYYLPVTEHIQNLENKAFQIVSTIEDFSQKTRHISLNDDNLALLNIKKVPYLQYWLTQIEPNIFRLIHQISIKELLVHLKQLFPDTDLSTIDIPRSTKGSSDIKRNEESENEIKFEYDRATYWASRVDTIRRHKKDYYTKVFVVNSKEQAKEINKYLGNKKTSTKQRLDKAEENPDYLAVVTLDDIRPIKQREIYKFKKPFLFVLDSCTLITTPQINSTSAISTLKLELEVWADGSNVMILDDLCKESKTPIVYDKSRAIECFAKEESHNLTEKEIEEIKSSILQRYNYTGLKKIQASAIENILSKSGQNHLVIVPTGGGKSTIFQGPIIYKATKALESDKCVKLSIVVTPLQALMKDQVEHLVEKNILNESEAGLVAYINADTTQKERGKIITRIREHKLALLYIAPERFTDRSFFQKVVERSANEQGIDSIIFDEAHCITAWGMEFRSDYILAVRKCKELQRIHKNITIQMYTATLPYQSKEDLKSELDFGENDSNILPSPDEFPEEYKESLCPIQDHIDLAIQRLDVSRDDAFNKKIDAIIACLDQKALSNLMAKRSRMIIFTRTREDAEKASELLTEKLPDFASNISFYHAGINKNDKAKRQEEYKNGKILILCATKAFGLGMDIPNVHYVFHLTPPTFIEDYLQEVGRAARDKTMFTKVFGEKASVKAVCFYTGEDLKGRINRVGRITVDDIRTSFETIKDYIKDYYKGDHINKTFVIPLDLISRVRYDEGGSENIFMQCINWLSKPNGLNRLSIGFKCSDSYDLGVCSDVECGINEPSLLGKLIKHLGLKNGTRRVIINANEIVGAELGINSPEELESIIEDGVSKKVFNYDFSYIHVSLCNKNTRDYTENNGELYLLEKIVSLLQEKNTNPDFHLDDAIKDHDEKSIEKIKKVWDFFVSMNILYTGQDIKDKIQKLVKKIYETHTDSVSWKIISEALNADGSDVNKVKLFLIASYKLGYTTKSETCRDFIEITVHNAAPIDETKDSTSINEINAFYHNKQTRAGAMCGLIEEFTTSDDAKDVIRKYSACPDDKIKELEIVRSNANRWSARECLEQTIKRELNDEQREIYNHPANININVMAGAGSGKTRLLIYRALKLMLVDGVKESKILLLAYNTAVRDEIEKRITEYSNGIGYTVKDAQIYTFHGFAAHCCPDIKKNKMDFDEWERELLKHIEAHPEKYTQKYQYLLIDEFQDVTATRLAIIKELLKLNTKYNPRAKIFVIGDMFQSIYGHEKKKDDCKKSIEPKVYYDELKSDWGESNYVECELKNNYRSSQPIINTAQAWFKGMQEPYKTMYNEQLPVLRSMVSDDDCPYGDSVKPLKPLKTIQDVPAEALTFSKLNWKDDFRAIWAEFINDRLTWSSNPQNNPKDNLISSIAILFRGNADVQDAYK